MSTAKYPLFSLNASHLIPDNQLLKEQKEALEFVLKKIESIVKYKRHIKQVTRKLGGGYTRHLKEKDGKGCNNETRDIYCQYLLRHRPHQVFTICGGRGSGKTSILFTLEYLLSEDRGDLLRKMYEEMLGVSASGYSRMSGVSEALEAMNDTRFFILPVIFPSEMEGLSQATLEAIVSKIDRKLDLALDNIRHEFGDADYGKKETRRNLEFLRSRLHKELATGWLLSREDGTGMQTLANDSVSFEDFADQRLTYVRRGFERVDSWRLFIDHLLDALDQDFMVILFDDTDLSPRVSKDMLSTIRIYLNHPRIITIVAADCVHLRREIIRINLKEHNWESCAGLERGAGKDSSDETWKKVMDYVRMETDEFLYKVLPHEGRVHIQFDTRRDCRGLFSDILKEEVKADRGMEGSGGAEANDWNLLACLPLDDTEREAERLEEYLDENLFLAAFNTQASRLMAFRRTGEWCWLGRSPREVVSSARKLMEFLGRWQPNDRDDQATDRQLLHILGQRPAASKVAMIPGLGQMDLAVIEHMIKRETLHVDDAEMTYSIDAQETPLGSRASFRAKDKGYYYLNLLLDTALHYLNWPEREVYPSFPICKLLKGLRRDRDASGPCQVHSESGYFWNLRKEWKRQGLLRGLGGVQVEGLEGMPAPVMNLADLAHLSIEGLGVSCNTVHEGEERLQEWTGKVEEEGISLGDPERKALARLAARDDYRNFMLRRLIAMVCMDKGAGDQIEYLLRHIGEGATSGDPALGKPGDPDLGRRDDGKSRMILKRCRIMVAWGLAAVFEEELAARGYSEEMQKLLNWLEEVGKRDFALPERAGEGAKRRHDFVTGDIPLEKIAGRIEELRELCEDSRFALPEDEEGKDAVERALITTKVLSTEKRLREFRDLRKSASAT